MEEIMETQQEPLVILEYYNPEHIRVNTEYYPKEQMKFVILKAYAWEKSRKGNYAVTVL